MAAEAALVDLVPGSEQTLLLDDPGYCLLRVFLSGFGPNRQHMDCRSLDVSHGWSVLGWMLTDCCCWALTPAPTREAIRITV